MSQGNVGVGAHNLAVRCAWPGGARGRDEPMAERSPSPGGAHNLAEWRPWPNGAYGREKPMAERSPSSDGARGRVAYMVERLAWPSDLCSQAVSMADRVQKLDECCAQLCRSYAFPGIQQVCAERSTSFCALMLGMGPRHEPALCRGGTGSRPAAGGGVAGCA